MKVNFLVADVALTGGNLVTFEAASRLRARGHDVAVHVPWVYPDFGRRGPLGVSTRLKASLGNALVHGRRPRWMQLRCKTRAPWSLCGPGVRVAHVSVASCWPSAEALARLPASCGAKVYLVQDYEVFSGPDERVDATYALPLYRIATAPWLVRLLSRRREGEPASWPVPLDLETFSAAGRRPPDARGPLRVLVLLHDEPRKGLDLTLEALARAKREVPLEVTGFGVRASAPGPPVDRVVRSPRGRALARLYARHDVYLALPRSEGWGLTVVEAMATGAAVVSSPVGALEYVDPDGEASVQVPADPGAAAEALVGLARRPDRIAQLGERGPRAVASLGWGPAVERFESLLRDAVERSAGGGRPAPPVSVGPA